MYQESVRRAAMNKALETNAPAMSGKITLVQEIDEDVQPGFFDLCSNIRKKQGYFICGISKK